MTTNPTTCPYSCSDYAELGDCLHTDPDWLEREVDEWGTLCEDDEDDDEGDDAMDWNRFVLTSAGWGDDEDYGYGDRDEW